MMNKKALGAVLVISALCASPAKCQGSNDDLTGFLHLMGKSTLDRGIVSPGDEAEINASTDSSNATVKISRSVSQSGNFNTFTLTASAPLDKNNDRTELANLDGLRNSFNLGLKYAWIKIGGRANPTASKATSDKNDEICAEMVAAFQNQTHRQETPDCDTNNVKTFLPARYLEFRSLFFANEGWMLSFGVEPKVGYKKFDFLDSATLDKISDRETPWSVEAFLGFTPPGWNTIITFGGNYQEGFKDADSGALCPSSGTGSTVKCKTGPVGPPKDDKAELLYAEFRRRLGPAGVSLKLTHDFKQDLTGVDLPIAFVKDKDGNLTGGIRVGWTKADHWQAGIFVGTAFSLFGR
jgi:hypothetical protein